MWAVSLSWEAQQLIGTARFMTGMPALTKAMPWAVTLWSSTSHIWFGKGNTPFTMYHNLADVTGLLMAMHRFK